MGKAVLELLALAQSLNVIDFAIITGWYLLSLVVNYEKISFAVTLLVRGSEGFQIRHFCVQLMTKTRLWTN